MNHYFTFGLHIASEFELPELLPDELPAPTDVTIRQGQTPHNLQNCQKRGVGYQIATNQFLLDLEDVARFYVANGDEIIFERYAGSAAKDIRLFLLGSCLGAILQQRKILALHASAIEHEGQAVLFTGNSGVGKSSTANAFRLKGHKMLTDDVCPIQFTNQVPFAVPGYPQSKLWEDTLEQLDIDYQGFKTIRNRLNKRAVPIPTEFVRQPLPVKALYILQPFDQDEIEINEVRDADKFLLVKNMTYRSYLLRDMGIQPYHFMICSQLAQSIPIRQLVRPTTFCLPEVLERIEQDLADLQSNILVR